MELLKNLKTERGRKKFEADGDKALAQVLADLRATKEANGGISDSAKAPRRGWQFTNSNFGMGM